MVDLNEIRSSFSWHFYCALLGIFDCSTSVNLVVLLPLVAQLKSSSDTSLAASVLLSESYVTSQVSIF